MASQSHDTLWWLTTIAGALGAAAGGYATSDLPGSEVAASVAGVIALLLGYQYPGRGATPQVRR